MADVLTVDGAGANPMSFLTGLVADTGEGSSGGAGSIDVTARRVELRNGGFFSGTVSGVGDGGTIDVTARELYVTGEVVLGNDGGILPSSIGTDTIGVGDGGAISLRIGAPGAGGVLEVSGGGQVTSGTIGRGDAGTITIVAGRLLLDGDGSSARIDSSALGSSPGDAGTVTVEADEVEIRDRGSIGSTSDGSGPAGDVRIDAGTLLIENAGIFTNGFSAEGGRITLEATDLIALASADVTSDGIVPAPGASLIALRAPLIVLNDSLVLSRTGTGAPLAGSGEARLLGDLTFISDDSQVLGSSTVELGGVDNTVGTGLQISPGAFLDAGGLLGQTCAARRVGKASTFARAGRKGGLPPSPDRPLSSENAKEQGRVASAEGQRLLVAGAALSAECDGRPLAGAM